MASNKIKKILLSGAVIGTYALYSYHQRVGDTSAPIIPPGSLAPSSSSGSTSSGSGSSNPANQTTTATYKDGTYTGSPGDAYYGNIQVKVTISGGKITDVVFLQYPNDRQNSVYINQQAMPYLKQEAIAAQSAQVDIVSGATDSSQAFIQSLGSALNQAQ